MSTLLKSTTKEAEVVWSTKVWNWSSPVRTITQNSQKWNYFWLKCVGHEKNNAVYMFDFSVQVKF